MRFYPWQNLFSIYQISEKKFSCVLTGSRNSEYSWLFATGAKMASRSETFLADEILATNEAVVQTNAKKATNFGLSVLLVGKKLFSC